MIFSINICKPVNTVPVLPIATIANAMDVGDPSNFARVLDLYGGSHAAISAEISGTTYTDEQIRETVKETWKDHHYLLDPHGACGYRALMDGLQPGETEYSWKQLILPNSSKQ